VSKARRMTRSAVSSPPHPQDVSISRADNIKQMYLKKGFTPHTP
jgi:hypothetical protein